MKPDAQAKEFSGNLLLANSITLVLSGIAILIIGLVPTSAFDREAQR